MITLTLWRTASMGQENRVRSIALIAGDIIFAGVSASGGGSDITLDTVTADVVTSQHVDTSYGDVTGKVWIVTSSGTGMIRALGSVNVDGYVAVFRPSELMSNVVGYTKTVVSAAKAWTDYLSCLDGEYVMCWQYASGDSKVVENPVPAHKEGTALITVVDHKLPEGAQARGNSFFELIRVDTGGTLRYYGPNPTMIRITIQGDPAAVQFISGTSFVLV